MKNKFISLKKKKKMVIIIRFLKILLNIYSYFIELIGYSLFILLSIGLFVYHFAFTIYMGWYLFVINIAVLLFIILRIINYINNKRLNIYILYIERCFLFISIILFIMPLNCFLLIYKLNKEWMNKFFLFLFFTLILLLIIFSYVYKINFLLFISFVLLFIWLLTGMLIYYDINKVNIFLKKYQVSISLVISSILYYINNNIIN